MANYFEITPPEGLSEVKLDSSGRAKVQYTVKNVSGIKRDGRAVLVSVPSAPGAVEKNWVKIDGPTDKSFEAGQSQTFVVNIVVPQKSPAGSYKFRLDTVLVAKPDEGDQSSPLTFNVTEGAAPKPFKWWIPVAAVVVLALIGVGVWLALRNKTPEPPPSAGITVPDLKGLSLQDATTTLTNAGLVIDPNANPSKDVVEASSDLVGKVAQQTPAAGDKADQGSQVQVKFGFVSVEVPDVTTLSLHDAQMRLLDHGLQPGTVKTITTTGAGGTVLSQSPAAGTKVATNSKVDLTATQQQVVVPQVVNMPVLNAITALQQANLVYGGTNGNQTQSNVTSSSPAPGTLVDVGTKVVLYVPSVGCRAPCFFAPTVIQQAGKFQTNSVYTVRPQVMAAPAVRK